MVQVLHRQGIKAAVGQSEKRMFEGWLSFSGLHDATFSIRSNASLVEAANTTVIVNFVSDALSKLLHFYLT